MSLFSQYRDRCAVAEMQREDGILVVRLQTDGGPLEFGSDHADTYQLADAFNDIANDPGNHVVVLTGTGDAFCRKPAAGLAAAASDPLSWDFMYRNRRRLLQNLLEIEAPVISAINGPALFHAEVPLLAGDIILASDTVAFRDSHAANGSVPGDGAHVIWPRLLGHARGRHFLLTGRVIEAEEALDIGLVNETMPLEQLMPRAMEVAQEISARPLLSNRYTRSVMNMEMRDLIRQYQSHGMALEGLALVNIRGWRVPEGGGPPDFPQPERLLTSPIKPNVHGIDE